MDGVIPHAPHPLLRVGLTHHTLAHHSGITPEAPYETAKVLRSDYYHSFQREPASPSFVRHFTPMHSSHHPIATGTASVIFLAMHSSRGFGSGRWDYNGCPCHSILLADPYTKRYPPHGGPLVMRFPVLFHYLHKRLYCTFPLRYFTRLPSMQPTFHCCTSGSPPYCDVSLQKVLPYGSANPFTRTSTCFPARGGLIERSVGFHLTPLCTFKK